MRLFNLFSTVVVISVAAALVSCGSETPVILDYSSAFDSECDIIRDQMKQSQAMLKASGREMDRQAARDGLATTYEQDMLATDRAMYEGMLSANGCN